MAGGLERYAGGAGLTVLGRVRGGARIAKVAAGAIEVVAQ
jgi:hypothetical protein